MREGCPPRASRPGNTRYSGCWRIAGPTRRLVERSSFRTLTVRNHLSVLYRSFGVRDLRQLISRASQTCPAIAPGAAPPAIAVAGRPAGRGAQVEHPYGDLSAAPRPDLASRETGDRWTDGTLGMAGEAWGESHSCAQQGGGRFSRGPSAARPWAEGVRLAQNVRDHSAHN